MPRAWRTGFLTPPLAALAAQVRILEAYLVPQSSRDHPQAKWRKNALRAAVVLVSALVAWASYL